MRVLILLVALLTFTGCAGPAANKSSEPIGQSLSMACGIASAADPISPVAFGICAGSLAWDLGMMAWERCAR
jgi:hypothetical protein